MRNAFGEFDIELVLDQHYKLDLVERVEIGNSPLDTREIGPLPRFRLEIEKRRFRGYFRGGGSE